MAAGVAAPEVQAEALPVRERGAAQVGGAVLARRPEVLGTDTAEAIGLAIIADTAGTTPTVTEATTMIRLSATWFAGG